MAWFGEGLSSLKGQLSNLAKNVLADEEENLTSPRASNDSPADPAQAVLVQASDSSWREVDEEALLQIGDPEQIQEATNKTSGEKSQATQNVDGDGVNIIPKGITNLFHQIGGAASQHIALSRSVTKRDVDVQTDPELSQDSGLAQLSRQNAELLSEVETLRRVVRDLESQIATSQDENANLSTGLEELDIQHQEAIERILTVKDEAVKELDVLKEQMKQKDADCSRLIEENQALKKQVEMLNLDIIGTETLSQENSELREKLSELMKDELPTIPEQSAVEEHMRTLEAEAAALRESRDNLERETASLLSQLQSRDAKLRQVDAKLEDVIKEKEIKEREMTQMVFECNSLREELKSALDMVESLEKEKIEFVNEISLIKSILNDKQQENEKNKLNLESARREASLAKDESETLKTELESLKEELGGETAKILSDMRQLEDAKKEQKMSAETIEVLKKQVIELEEGMEASRREVERREKEFEEVEKELNKLRGSAREYNIQKDVFREKEAELKRQLADSLSQLASANAQLASAKEDAGLLVKRCSQLEEEKAALPSVKQLSLESNNEIVKYQRMVDEVNSEKEKLVSECERLSEELRRSKDDLLISSNELYRVRSELHTRQIDVEGYESVIESFGISLQEMKKDEGSDEKFNKFLAIKDKLMSTINRHAEEIKNLNSKLVNSAIEKNKLVETISEASNQNDAVILEKQHLEEANDALQSKLNFFSTKCEELSKNIEEGKTTSKKGQEELKNLRQQVDHLKDELSEVYNEKQTLASEIIGVSSEKEQLHHQIQALRSELDTIPKLKQELEVMKQNIEDKNQSLKTAQSEIQRLNHALSVQLNKNESLHVEKTELLHRNEELLTQLQRKMTIMEDTEGIKNKEIDSLKQEIDSLKTQLEYASQLLQDVERQEGEGQPSGEQSQKISPESQEELSRLSALLLKEQTDKKILQNQLSEREERLEKAEIQLQRLKSHLVEVQESYSSELTSAEEKLREMQVQLVAAEERARSSTTAYTSASIRSNQQVEALREQVRLLNEHKEQLEQQISTAEDSAAKQATAVTRLQAVLHHFQIDKQKDIDFETERIRRDLVASGKRNDDLKNEIKTLQEQLEEARRGLAAGQRLSEQLLQQSDTITRLKNEIFELNEKIRLKEEKMNNLKSENKVDRQLVANLVVGYVASPAEAKTKVLGVLGQVLSFTKEERQRVGLEPGGRQQTLSEAFIKFLQAESQPRPEVLLPLPTPSPLPPSRKSSLLTPEVPVLPHFPVGRNPGSILKDVLQDRRPE